MMTASTYDAITIADEILRIAKKRGSQLSPMKLMKLTYIAHGWALALLKRDLFRNRIEAWQYGPVIPDLYRATKSYGRNDIPLDRVGDDMATDAATRQFLESVYDRYGHLSAIALSNLTHQSGTPWAIAYRHGVRGVQISDESIRQHYHDLNSASQPAA